jgi:flagellar basal-body rod modification protein FlgD
MTDIAATNTTGQQQPRAYGLDTAQRAENSSTSKAPTNKVDKDMFLQLLVAQLRYQNPLDPSSPDDFMAQTAQFTMVESLEELSTSTAAANRSQMISTASSLVGREVTYTPSSGPAKTGIVSSARISDDGTVLRIGNVDVPLESVTSIAAAPTNGVTGGATGATNTGATNTGATNTSGQSGSTNQTGPTQNSTQTSSSSTQTGSQSQNGNQSAPAV